MKTLLYSFYACLALAMTTMVTAFLPISSWISIGIVVLIGLSWAFAVRLSWYRFCGWAFFIWILLSIAAIWLGRPGFWLVISITAALAAFDLSEFITRIGQYEADERLEVMIFNHLKYLGVVAAVALLLGLLASLAEMRLTFGLALLLGCLLFLGFSRIVQFLRRDPEDDIPSEAER